MGLFLPSTLWRVRNKSIRQEQHRAFRYDTGPWTFCSPPLKRCDRQENGCSPREAAADKHGGHRGLKPSKHQTSTKRSPSDSEAVGCRLLSRNTRNRKVRSFGRVRWWAMAYNWRRASISKAGSRSRWRTWMNLTHFRTLERRSVGLQVRFMGNALIYCINLTNSQTFCVVIFSLWLHLWYVPDDRPQLNSQCARTHLRYAENSGD